MQFLKISSFFALLIVFSLACGGCGEDKVAIDDTVDVVEKPKVKVPAFNKDTAYAFVEKQVAFGSRVLGSKAHDDCRDWMIEKLESYGASVTSQDFEAVVYTGEKFPASNIIASFNPENQERIILAAHWDSRHVADSPLSKKDQNVPILGADDGGSGVGVLLEMARQFHISAPTVGVDIILFDAEDYGEHKEEQERTQAERDATQATWALGSQYWAKNFTGNKPKYGVLLDMVGGKNARFTKEGYSMQAAPRVVNQIWRTAAKMGYGHYFENVQGGGITDDHFFVMKFAQIPMIDIINLPAQTGNGSFPNHWHTHNDNMDAIDARTLRAVGQVMLAVVYRDEVEI